MSLLGLDLNKVDGSATVAESFNRNLDFYTITISGTGSPTFRADGQSPALDAAGDPVNIEQYLFNKMIEVISTKAQPILVSIVGGTGTGRTVFSVVLEHGLLWSEATGAAAGTESMKTVLETAIRAITNDADTAVYPADFTATVVYSATLS